MAVSFNKSGIINVSEYIESEAKSEVLRGTSTLSFTPTTTNNSNSSYMYKWFYPDGTIAGDKFVVFITVDYNGFDTSNTSGTFRMVWQGTNFTSKTASAWSGTNLICSALNNKQTLTNVVLSATSGTYTYETTFTMTQDFLNSYLGSHIGIRSDYSNGTGKIVVSNPLIIPEKYSTNNSSAIEMRVADNYIVTNEFIEY